MIIITFGTFDLLHIGHIKILEKAKSLGDKLIVGVSSDNFSFKKIDIQFIINMKEKKILESLKFVDEVFFEESFEKKENI